MTGIKDNIEFDEDNMFKELMHSTKKQASQNLSYRIMHQIETEAALTKKQPTISTEKSNPLKVFWGIYGIMYLLIALLVTGAYIIKGKEYLLSSEFIGIVIFVTFLFSIYWLMTKVEERYRQRTKKE